MSSTTYTDLSFDELAKIGREARGREAGIGQEPDIEQAQEQLEPGYWESPQTLAMHYQFLNNGVNYPWGEWLEPGLLNDAYDHVKKFNEGKSTRVITLL